jgi:RNA polymerase sigma factor FliA
MTEIRRRSREELILAFIPMVRRIAYRMAARCPACVEAEELVNIGTLGLISAVNRYTDDQAISFPVFVKIRVQGAILDSLREADFVPRSVRDDEGRLRRAREELKRALGRDPDDRELAEALGLDIDRYQLFVTRTGPRSMVSTEEPQDDGITLGDTLASSVPLPDEAALRESTRLEVRKLLEKLSARERVIVDLYYDRDMTLKEIGAVLGVTEGRVSRLHSRILEKLAASVEDPQAL